MMLNAINRVRAKKKGPSGKPSYSPAKGGHKRKIILVVVSILFCANLFKIAISEMRQILSKWMKGSNENDEQNCKNAQKMQVVSHQILNAPLASGRLGNRRPPDGSLRAMECLWQAGITSFDIDVVTLSNGILLAAHPLRFARAIGKGKKAEDYTLQEAREAGADEEGFPILRDVLMKFGELVKSNGKGPFYEIGSSSSSPSGIILPNLGGPLLNIDLKGPNLNKQLLSEIERWVMEFGIKENVVLCATALESGEEGPGIDILRWGIHEGEGVSIGLVLRDRVQKDKDIGRVVSFINKFSAIKILVPSNKFDIEYFDEVIRRIGLPVVSWTVDDIEGMLHAIEAGLSGIVSNHPIVMDKMLQSFKKNKCS